MLCYVVTDQYIIDYYRNDLIKVSRILSPHRIKILVNIPSRFVHCPDGIFPTRTPPHPVVLKQPLKLSLLPIRYAIEFPLVELRSHHRRLQ